MALVHHRVILKPPGLSGDDCAKLAERLAEAVAWQQELAAKSPHVLQLTGPLSESESAFTVEHEPATPILEPSVLFDATATKCDEESLLNVAAALFDALRVAHATQRNRLRAHGGLCLGVLLRSEDGIEKITDFGVVPAVFTAIGTEAYLNLGLRPLEVGSPEVLATGAWEVLDPDEFDREDRLCAFVDPEKYGLGRHEGFEPGSDAIAAGFILHLMAEHVHPYLPDADAHRMVEMSEFMAGYRYNSARRKELRESTNPAIQTWCDLVGKLLARLPQNRPTFEELVQSLGQHVKAVDIGEILRRRLKAAEQLVEEKEWTELRAAVKDFVEAADAPADVVERANELLRLANAHLLLDRAVDILKGDDWRNAREPLDGILALPAVPPAVAQRTKKAIAVLEHNLAVVSEIAEITTRAQEDDGSDLAQTRILLEETVARAKELAADQSSLPPVQAESAQIRDELAGRLETVVAELEKLEAEQRADAERLQQEQEEDQKVADGWLADLQAAVEGEDWDILQEFLDKRPDLKHWPEVLDPRVAEIEQRLSDHLAERQRLAAIEADRDTAEAWITGVLEIVDAERWADAEKALSDKPQLTHWPEDVETQARELAETVTAQIHKVAIEADRNTAEAWIATARQAVESEQWEQAEQALAEKPQLKHWPEDVETQRRELAECVKVAQQRQVEFGRARQWHGELKQQIDNKEWGKAADVLSGRPALEYWPEDVLEDEARFRTKIQEQMEAAELEQRQIAAWIEAANGAARAELFEEALRMLDAPPIDAKRIPKKIRKQVKMLAESFAAARAEQIKRLVEDRSKAVLDLAQAFARDVVSEELSAFLDLGLLRITVSDEQFDGPDEFTECTATLAIQLDHPAVSKKDREEAPITFRRDGDSLRIQGESSLKKRLLGHLTTALAKLQKAALIELTKPLKQGAFPKTEVSVKLGGLEGKVKAAVCLLGAKSPAAKIEAKLNWAPHSLTWEYEDAEAFVRQTLSAAAAAAQETLSAELPKRSEPLLRYKASLATEVVPVALANRTSVPESLSFEARLVIHPHGTDAPTQLHTFPVECPKIGEVSPEPDTGPAVAALGQLIAAAQSGSRAGLQDELMKRVGETAVKVKLKALPKRITSPVDDVQFELFRKRHDPVTLTASWNADQFSYDPAGSSAGESWDDALGGILAPPTAREKRSGLMPIAVAAVVVIAAGGGGYAFWNTRATQERVAVAEDDNPPDFRPAETTDANDSTTSNQNESAPQALANNNENDDRGSVEDPEVVVEPEPSEPSAIAGVNEARAVLTECRQLSPHAAQLIAASEDEGTEAPTLTYRLPGLLDGEWVVTLEESGTDGAWLLPEQDKQAMQARVNTLRELLEPSSESSEPWSDFGAALAAAVEGPRYAEVLDPSRLSYQLDRTPSWQLRADHWETGDTAGRVSYSGIDDAAGGNTALLAFPSPLQLRDGIVSFLKPDGDDSFAENVRAEIDRVLGERRIASTQDRTEELEDALGANGLVEQASEASGDPEQRIELVAKAQWLVERTFPAVWDVESLSFVLDQVGGRTWGDRVSEMARAHELLGKINDQLLTRDHWLGRGASKEVREFSEPDEENRWVLTTPAPWADFVTGTPFTVEDLLRFTVDSSRLRDGDVDRQVGAILADASEPPYWRLIGRYTGYRSEEAGTYLDRSIERIAFVEALDRQAARNGVGAALASYLASTPAPSHILPQVFLDPNSVGKPALTGGAGSAAAAELSIPLGMRWGVKQVPNAAPETQVLRQVKELTVPLACTLTLRVLPSGDIGADWIDDAELSELVANLENEIAKVRALERALSEYEQRARVETALASHTGDGAAADLGDRQGRAAALDLLRAIWTLKLPGQAQPESLQAVVVWSGNRSKGRRGSKNKALNTLKPTIFAEYFCGESDCYAIAWSAGADKAIVEGPFVLRLCETALLDATRGTADVGLGEALIQPILAKLPNATQADQFGAFKTALGVALAPDDAMGAIDLSTLRFNEVESQLAQIERGQGGTSTVSWASLDSLVTDPDLKARRCDYWLYRALAAPKSRFTTDNGDGAEARRWARAALRRSGDTSP